MRFIHASSIRLNAEPVRSGALFIDRKTEYHDNFMRLLSKVRETGAELLVLSGSLFGCTPGVREMIETEGALSTIGRLPVVIFVSDEAEYEALRGYPWPPHISLRSPLHNEELLLKEAGYRLEFGTEAGVLQPEAPDRKRKHARFGRLLFLSESTEAADLGQLEELSDTYEYIGLSRAATYLSSSGLSAPGTFSEEDFRTESRGGFFLVETRDRKQKDGKNLRRNPGPAVQYVRNEALTALHFSVDTRQSLLNEQVIGSLRSAGGTDRLFGRFTEELVKKDEAELRRSAIAYGLRMLSEEEQSLKEKS